MNLRPNGRRSPQPPPLAEGCIFASVGRSCRPTARLRAGFELESVRQDRAGRSLPAAEARSSATNLRALRRLLPELEYKPKRARPSILILNLEF